MERLIDWMWHLVEVIFLGCIRILEKLIHKDIPEKTRQVLLQFVKFGIVGVSNSLINYLAYVASLLLLRKLTWFAAGDFLAAQIVAFVLSVLWSYYWNNRYVFAGETEKSSTWMVTLAKTFVAYSFTGLILSEALLLLWVNVVGLSEFVAPVLNILICFPINFVINKLWTFK